MAPWRLRERQQRTSRSTPYKSAAVQFFLVLSRLMALRLRGAKADWSVRRMSNKAAYIARYYTFVHKSSPWFYLSVFGRSRCAHPYGKNLCWRNFWLTVVTLML
jgi:hypothetical protein